MRDSHFALRLMQRLANALQHGRESDTAFGVGLRVEKDFHMHCTLFVGLAEIRSSQSLEVFLVTQYVRSCIVDVEKGLQIRETISPTQLLDRGVGQRHAVLL